MALTIPNLADAGFAAQAEPDSRDIDAMVSALNATAVLSGCAVTAQGTPDMTVAVAAGNVITTGTVASVTAGNATITAADATNPRIDLVVVTSAGALAARAGTAAASPVFPTLTAGDVLLAAVYVPANDTAINANQIIDKRMIAATPAGLGDRRVVIADSVLNADYSLVLVDFLEVASNVALELADGAVAQVIT